MAVVRIEQFKQILGRGKSKVAGEFDDHAVEFFFGKSKTGFGYRHYFICPSCGKYRTALIFANGAFTCFKCAGINPYAGIQKTTRGGYEFIGYKMQRYAKKNGVTGFCFPFDYRDYERPKRYRWERWHAVMKVLQELESMRNQSIFFEKIWSAETIRSIEKGTNEYMRLPVSLHLEYFYPYDQGCPGVGVIR